MKNTIQLIILISTTILLSDLTMANTDTLDSLKQLTWKNRILLIKPKVDCDQEATTLLSDKLEIDDRDIVWFVFCNEQVETNFLGQVNDNFIQNTIEELFIRDDVTVILVGKDGGVKRRTDELDLTRLYELIDSMPMRQSEMRK